MTGVVLVDVPFSALERPSLALGLIAGALGEEVPHLYMGGSVAFAEEIGLPLYALVQSAAPRSLLGDWLFSGALRSSDDGEVDFVRRESCLEASPEFVSHLVEAGGHKDLNALLLALRARAGGFVEDFAERVLANNPKVIACSSMFDQHAASLALLRAVKLRAPEVVTVIGGANCAEDMGWATHHQFPFVDWTVTGEFDDFFLSFFADLLSGVLPSKPRNQLPPNLLGPQHRSEGGQDVRPQTWMATRLDTLPTPDFSGYFRGLYSSELSRYVSPTLVLETSRGCWWGAKQHCTFCGLNASGMAFRRKSSGRALEEIRSLTKSSGVPRWMAADNIVDLGHLREVLPELAKDEAQYSFFYETKANLSEEQVEGLAAAGCRVIQPGIESLHDPTLRVMKKGTTSAINLGLLRTCIEAGVLPIWSVLCGFPETDPEAVLRVAEQFPALGHLPPPNGATPIRYDRFSPHHSNPESFGLRLRPVPSYRRVYGLTDEWTEKLAYFFEPEEDQADIERPAAAAQRLAEEWRLTFWGPQRPELVLQAEHEDGSCVIRDTRSLGGAGEHRLNPELAFVLEALRRPSSLPGLERRCKELDHRGVKTLDAAIEELEERALLWRGESQLVSLVCRPPRRPITPDLDRALGRVNWRGALIERARAQARRAAAGA